MGDTSGKPILIITREKRSPHFEPGCGLKLADDLMDNFDNVRKYAQLKCGLELVEGLRGHSENVNFTPEENAQLKCGLKFDEDLRDSSEHVVITTDTRTTKMWAEICLGVEGKFRKCNDYRGNTHKSHLG